MFTPCVRWFTLSLKTRHLFICTLPCLYTRPRLGLDCFHSLRLETLSIPCSYEIKMCVKTCSTRGKTPEPNTAKRHFFTI